MPGECWNCGRWLSGADLLEGYCWDCGRRVSVNDGSRTPNQAKTED